MKKAELIALGATIGGVALAAFARSKGVGRPEVRGVEIASVVLEERNGTCRVVFKDDPIKAGRGAVIIWAVDNRCPSTQSVSLTAFSPSNPLLRRPPSRSVHAGRIRFMAETIRPNAAYGSYRYAIGLNGVLQDDPEIIIEY